jgi:hypothetical protein
MAVGDLKNVVLDGVGYNAIREGDSEETRGKFEKTAIIHSGGVTQQFTLRSSMVTAPLLVTEDEAIQIEQLADQQENFPLSYTQPDGTVRRCIGFIVISTVRSNRTGEMTIEMHAENNQWETF